MDRRYVLFDYVRKHRNNHEADCGKCRSEYDLGHLENEVDIYLLFSEQLSFRKGISKLMERVV